MIRERRFPTDMKKLASISILFFLTLAFQFTACETEDWHGEIDCADCFTYKPDSARIWIYLTANSENDSIPIVIYRGNYEDGIEERRDTATSDFFDPVLAMGKIYTIEAKYRDGNETILAYDSDKMTIYNANDECGSTCYIIEGGIFDLELIR